MRTTLAAGVLLAAWWRLAGAQVAPDPPTPVPPSFPSQVSAITVDAVVLDKSGAPVRGLTRDDFTVFEDGRPQTIVGFEARDAEAGRGPAPPLVSPLFGTNEDVAARPGRTLVLLIDDLGLTPTTGHQVQTAIERWLRARPLPEDEVTLLTTSGDIWWADRVGPGRADLLAVLERLRGKRESGSRSEVTVTDEEASVIEYASPLDSGDSQGSPLGASAGPPTGTGPALVASTGSVLQRVAQRLLAGGLCFVCTNCVDPMASCKAAAQSAAHLANGATRRRLDALLGTVERLSRGLAPLPGRKSILVLSDNFLRDDTMEYRYRSAIDGAQRGNTSVYFTAARGLTGPSSFSAEGRVAAAPGDLAAMSVEENLVAFAGAEQITEATGGTLSRSNDLSAGLDRMAADLSAYYLLGYQPEPSAPGKWHKLEVRVNRPGVEVRARRGYRAGPPPVERAPDVKNARRQLSNLVAASLAGGAREVLPLRLAASLQAPDGAGKARVQLVVEVDGSRVRLEEAPEGAKAELELTILAVARDRPTIVPLGETIQVALKSKMGAEWWAFVRDVHLPPGVAQIRATVRDRAGAAAGTATARLEVPDVEAPYLATPLLTDRTQRALVAGDPPRLVPTARRAFTKGRVVHCQYEVFGFGGRDMPGVPLVAGGYTLQAADGRVIEVVPPTLIGTDGRRVVRRISLPTARLEPGAYELLLGVEDRLARRAFSARETFVVEAEDLR
jgi:VWFA-related protein